MEPCRADVWLGSRGTGARATEQLDARQWARDAAVRFADLAGVERLEGFSLGSLMSESPHRHSSAEIERRFSTGLPETTPPVMQIEPGWPRPWMFARVSKQLVLGVLGVLGFLGFLAWVLAFGYLQSGVQQIQVGQQGHPPDGMSTSGGPPAGEARERG